MIQIVSVLTTAMIFTGLSTRKLDFIVRIGGGLMRETKVPVQELWLKMGGGAYVRGGAYGRNSTV